MMKNRIAVAVCTLGLGVVSGCGNSDNSRYTANDAADANPANSPSEVSTTPVAAVIERTAVVAVNTNESPADAASGAPAQTTTRSEAGNLERNSSTTISTNSSVATQANGAAAENERGQSSSAASKSEKYIDYQVLDANGKSIGTVEALWDDEKGKPAFLAIKKANQDKLCVIPTSEVQESQNRKALKVPYTGETLQEAPTFSSESDLDAEAQQKVMAFFDNHEPAKLQAATTDDQSGDGKGALKGSDTGGQSQLADAERLNQATIQLKEERVKVGKRQVDAGGVLLRKVVRTETVNKPVQLKHEEFVIERVPGSGKPVDGNAEFAEREVFIPLIREEPVVQKEVVLKETVNVGKTAKEEQQTINARKREEELQIQRRGDAQESSGSPGGSSSGTESNSVQGGSQQNEGSTAPGQQSLSQQNKGRNQ